MSRLIQLAIVFALLVPTTTFAQDWASGLFTQPKHDFGTVARSAKTEHVFTFKNTTGNTITISSVRASCGCTIPSIVTRTVPPGEIGAIRAQFNTTSFVGQRGATITVQMTTPAFAEVQLRVDGFVRRDIVFHPGEVQWGTVAEGTPISKKINIAYAGRNDWQITKVSCGNKNVKLKIVETARGNGLVNYQLQVELLKSATAGYINDEIIFETNDQRLRSVPLKMSGNVESALTVNPAVLHVDAKQGDVVNKMLFLKGNAEFQITGVRSTDPAVKIQQQVKRSRSQKLPISIDTNGKVGKFECELMISTDLNGISRPVKIICEIE